MDWDPVSCCWAVLLNHVLFLSLWNCLHEASLPIYPCKNLTGEAKRVLQEIFHQFHKWSAGCAQTSTEKATNSTIHLLGFATLGVVPSEPKDSGLPPLTSSLCSPHQLALTGDRFFFLKKLLFAHFILVLFFLLAAFPLLQPSSGSLYRQNQLCFKVLPPPLCRLSFGKQGHLGWLHDCYASQ